LASFTRGDLGSDAAWWSAAPGQWIALSDLAPGAVSLPEAAHQARYAMALVEAGLVSGSIVRFDMLDDLGPYRLLYRLWGTPDLSVFITDALGDLLNQDRRGSLRATLLAYLDAGGSHVEAAARLGIHRNTLSYRLKQIEELTGCSPDNPQRRLVLHLAVLAAGLPSAPGVS
jgi:DNA-binding PucR family transcriptional regulator